MGKITVVKSLALPKLVHLFTSLPNIDPLKFNELNSIFYSFIWNGKSERIKRNTLIGDFLHGGLKMTHLQSFNSYLKVGWIKRLFANLDGNWQKLLLYSLNHLGGERVFTLLKDKLGDISGKINNTFWREVCFWSIIR